MLSNPNELARLHDGAVECRAEPLRIQWTFADLHSADSHNVGCRFAASVRIADNAADRRIFVEVFLASGNVVDAAQVAAHFQSGLRAAAAITIGQYGAADLVARRHNPAILESLTKAAKPIAFACGLELLPPYQIELESQSLQRQKLEEIARVQAEKRQAGQLQQLQHAGELLRQFQQLRQNAPDLPAGKLLERMNPADRGLTFQTLLLASSSESAHQTLWAVAGNSLIRIDPRAVPPRTELMPLPTDLGPLRSVQPATIDGEPMLLVGARAGVMLVSPRQPADATLYAISNLDSQLGFNRVVCAGGRIWASHSHAGIVGWKRSQNQSPFAVYAEAAQQIGPSDDAGVSIVVSGAVSRATASQTSRSGGAKNLQMIDDDTLIYSVGHELVLRRDEQRTTLPPRSAAEIIAIIPTPRQMIAVHQDGTLVIVERMTREVVDVRHRGAQLTAAGAMPWLGDLRLLLANDQGPIDCLGLDDPLVSEYLSPYRGLKVVTATTELIAAVSPDRQRVIVWNAWDGQRPLGEIHITSIARHRVADLEFES